MQKQLNQRGKIMHIGKSTKHCLLHYKDGEKDANWLGEQLHTSADSARYIMRNKDTGTKIIRRLAEVFEMKVSEFIALGESK